MRIQNKIILIGTACSGKTTLAKRLEEEFNLMRLDIASYCRRYETVNGSLSDDDLCRAYYDLTGDLMNGRIFDILELGSDFPEEMLPAVFYALKDEPRVLAYIDAPSDVCIARNKDRKAEKQVSEGRIIRQAEYDIYFYGPAATDCKAAFAHIETHPQTVEESYAFLKRRLWHIGEDQAAERALLLA